MAQATEQAPDNLTPWHSRAMTVPEQFDLALTCGHAGGKTRKLASMLLCRCEQHGSRARCLVVRKSFPRLQDIEAELREYFTSVYGRALRWDRQKHKFTLPGDGIVQLDQLERGSDFAKFQEKSFSHGGITQTKRPPIFPV